MAQAPPRKKAARKKTNPQPKPKAKPVATDGTADPSNAKPAKKVVKKKAVPEERSVARSVEAELVEAQPTSGLRPKTVSPRPPSREIRSLRDADQEPIDHNGEVFESPLAHGPSDEDLEEMDDGADLDTHLPEIVAAASKKRALLPSVEKSSASSTGLSSTDPVTTYLAEIRKYGLLTREQEHELAVRYREHGDSKAAEMLVTSNLRFVVKIAAEYSRFGAKLIDLIQEGNVGLMHAVREYNPYKGVKLITYAVWWIRGYIQEYLMRQYSMVRIGTTQNQRKLFYRLQKEKDLLESMGRDSNFALLSSRLGVTEDEVATMTKRLSGRDVSLSQPLDGGDSAATLLDFEESHEPDAEMQIGEAEEMKVLKDNIAEIRPHLSEKELYLLDERILADDPLTLQEIGEHYGVTREAVRQLEARLIGKIRTAVTESLGVGERSSEET